jgi:hypothetical protein
MLNCLLFLSTVDSGADYQWQSQVQAFVSAEHGTLQTEKLPSPLLLSLREKLTDFGNDDAVRTLLAKTALHPVVIDSGASACSSFDENDFIPGSLSPIENQHMDGIAANLQIKAQGILRYEVITDDGSTATIECWGYLIPDLPIRLLSPQVHLRDTDGPSSLYEYGMRREVSVLHLQDGRTVTVPYNNVNMLPLLYVSTNMSKSEASYTTYESASLLDEKNQNLSYSQKVILAWHQKLNHIGFGHVKWLASKGYLGNKTKLAFNKLEQFELPKCATCQFGKQERRSTPERMSKKAKAEDIIAEGTITLSGLVTYKPAGILKQGADKPGSRVAMDQYVHTTPGRGPSIKGITPSTMQYVGGTLFVDCHTGYIKCVHQTSLNALDTLLAKQTYEHSAALHGVQVTGYHTDDGLFTARSFIDEIQKSKQRITFTGVNAHHQNIAERAIKTTHYLARCMMLHAAIHWPEAYDPSLWPFAVSYACHIMNSLPRQDTNASPEELWTGIKVDHESVLDALLPWGCPSYVLDSTLASGGKIPKFQPRSRRAQFLGFSEFKSQWV